MRFQRSKSDDIDDIVCECDRYFKLQFAIIFAANVAVIVIAAVLSLLH
jgi:hypothetical protein